MDISEYVRALRRSRILVVAACLLGVLISLLYCLLKAPEYEAESIAFVSTDTASSISDLTQGGSYAQQAVKGYTAVVVSPYVLNPVIQRLKLKESARSLSENVSVVAPVDTTTIEIVVTDKSAVGAAKIANAISEQLATAVVALTPDTAASTPSVKVTQLQPAVVPETPSSPNWRTALLLGLVGGLVVGLAVSVLRHRLDNVVRTVSSLRSLGLSSIVGIIGFDADAKQRPLLTQSGGRRERAEEFRALRTNLNYLTAGLGEQARVFAVTSSIPSEGKSTTSANLAVVLAEANKRTLLIDADMRRPKLESYLGLPGGLGLSDVLIGAADATEAVQRWGPNGLAILVAGTMPPNPSELLQSARMARLMSELRDQYDVILIDTPPLLPVTDAAIVATLTDGALLVCALSRVRNPQVIAAAGSLHKVGARILGVIATMVPNEGMDSYSRGYEYYSYTAAEPVIHQSREETSSL